MDRDLKAGYPGDKKAGIKPPGRAERSNPSCNVVDFTNIGHQGFFFEDCLEFYFSGVKLISVLLESGCGSLCDIKGRLVFLVQRE